MKRMRQYGITVLYEPYQEESVVEFFQIVGLHPVFMATNFPKKISITIPSRGYTQVDSLEGFVKSTIQLLMNDRAVIDYEAQINLYYNLLLEEYDKNNEFVKQRVFDIDTILCLAGLAYYETPEEYEEYLIHPKEENYTNVYLYLKERFREDIFNRFLETFWKQSKDLEDHYVEHVIRFLKSRLLDIDNLIKEYSTEKNPFTPLSREQLEAYLKELLQNIDPTDSLWNLYQEGIKKYKIEFKMTEEPEEDNPSEVTRKDGVLHMYQNGNTHDFKVLAHEFAHYAQLKKGKTPVYSLNEFLSIFLELEAIDLLERKGYSEEEIEAIGDIRRYSVLNIFLELSELYVQIYEKGKGKFVTLDHLYQVMKEFSKKEEEDYSLEDAKKLMDVYTISFIEGGSSILDKPAYLIGYYYAKRLQECEDKYERFNYILSHLEEYDLDRLKEEFGEGQKTFQKRLDECDIMN